MNATRMPVVVQSPTDAARKACNSLCIKGKVGLENRAANWPRAGKSAALDQMIEIGRDELIAVQPNPYPGRPDVYGYAIRHAPGRGALHTEGRIRSVEPQEK
jgi:hypothetical protein